MSDIFFLEFREDIPVFLEHRDPDDLVVAVRPEVAAELDIQGISYKCLQTDYYTHKEYMSNSLENNDRLMSILNSLDDSLWRTDRQFRDIELRPFQMFAQFFKISLQCLWSKVFELDKFFSKESVINVKIIKHPAKPVRDSLYFFDDESVYEKLLYLMRSRYKYEVKAIGNNSPVGDDKVGFSDDVLNIPRQIRAHIIRQIKGLLKKSSRSEHASSEMRGTILSVNCGELSYIEQELNNYGWSIDAFPGGILDMRLSYMGEYAELIDNFQRDKELVSKFNYLDFDCFGIFKSRLEYFCRNLGRILRNYRILSDYIGRRGFDIVFFSTHTPHEMQNVLLPFICRKYNIPYVCWMHGGYGANRVVHGYDITDYKFGQHYFVYGEGVKQLIDGDYSQYGLQTHVVGSPMIARRYRDYNAVLNGKKTITLVLPPWSTNRQYLEIDTPYSRFSYWEPIKASLELLVKYRDKYRIIIRGASSKAKPQLDTLTKFLKWHNAPEIKVSTADKMSFKAVVGLTDLFINFWVSTTFWEESFTKADIFLMDNSDLTEEARKTIPTRAFWYEDLAEFIKGLKEYLDRGVFYHKNNNQTFLKDYMDYDRRDHIATNVSETIEEIIKVGSRA